MATKTRLTEKEVLTIARGATIAGPFHDAMYLTKVEERRGRLVWLVASASIGSGLEIEIDDATGEIISTKHVGVR